MSTTTVYNVAGMTCDHCAQAVTAELRDLTGVSDVRVDLVPGETSTVSVTSDEQLSREQVVEALEEAGDYRLAGVD